MSANNNNWVCFPCQTTLRKPKTLPIKPRCPECAATCFCLGYKVEVPKRADVRGWHRLRLECEARAHASSDQDAIRHVREVHAKEHQIAHLQSLSPNPGRQKLIRKLKKEI